MIYTQTMCDEEQNSGFLFALDYVLNKASIRELEVFTAGIERRKKQFGYGLSDDVLEPMQAAKRMSEAVYASINASIEGVRNTFRDYAAGLLEKEAPELSQEQVESLLDLWVPPVHSRKGTQRTSLAKSGKVQGIPADLVYEMVVQFVSYSLGEMPVETQQDLSSAMRNWTNTYWQRFPVAVRQEIKSFLNGEISSGVFQRNVHELLGLA